ncbi:hypothetical protein POM88_004987 [Heracleum sosnowskyi]|uniref:Uncharacterized protein n=1 Tax=Heracleum sosnowskyi TaxID=360622 RepID=A0AAD8JJ39_9APIA|nr:hypothetical protein POM88_004987 [Heracleum sosnowskyi]
MYNHSNNEQIDASAAQNSLALVLEDQVINMGMILLENGTISQGGAVGDASKVMTNIRVQYAISKYHVISEESPQFSGFSSSINQGRAWIGATLERVAEVWVIIRYQGLLGNRWAAIAAHLPSRTDNDIKNYWHTHLKKNLGEVNGSGDERAQNYEGSKHNGDAAASGLDHMKAYCEAGNSMTTTPQNNELKKSVYDDIGILALKSIEKWLLDDHSAPFPQILSVPDPAPVPQVFPAQAPAAVPQVRSAPVSAVVSQVFPSPAPAPQVPPVLTPIEKWLLENSSAPVPPGIDQAGTGDQRALPAPFPPFLRALVSAPVPQVLRAQAPAPFPQVTPALEPFPQVTPAPAPAPASAPSSAPNMFAPFVDQAGTGDQRALPAPFPPFLRALVSAPVPQVLRAKAPAPFPQVTPALEPFPQVTPAPAPAPASAPSSAPNMFAPFGHCQISFGPFY